MNIDLTKTENVVARWEDGRSILLTGERDLWLASGAGVAPATLKETVTFWRNQQRLTQDGFAEPTTYSDEAFGAWLRLVESEL